MWEADGKACAFLITEGSQATARAERDITAGVLKGAGGIETDPVPMPLYSAQLARLEAEGEAEPASLAHGTFPALIRASQSPTLGNAVIPALDPRGGYLLLEGAEATTAAEAAGCQILAQGNRLRPFDPHRLKVMRRIKAELDPDDLINPGLVPPVET
jgi:hypothetical protein